MLRRRDLDTIDASRLKRWPHTKIKIKLYTNWPNCHVKEHEDSDTT
jgi:hypothetical protein